MEEIGVRELRQNASRYLARVARGEALNVTSRGRVVARLVPVESDSWQDLIASGRIAPPDEESDLLGEPPADYRVDASVNLARARARER